MDKIFNLLKVLSSNDYLSQRNIADKTKFSLGMVNTLIQKMKERDLIEIHIQGYKTKYSLTEKGNKFLDNLMREQMYDKLSLNSKVTMLDSAVILAAGENEHFDQPIGLLGIDKNATIIDRTIDTLIGFGITDIYIVIGYKKELYYKYLKNRNIHFIENDKYKWTGTMYSLSLVKNHIKGDFLLIEADHLYEKQLIHSLINYKNPNCMFLTKLNGGGNDAFVEFDKNNNLYKISKDMHQLNHIDACLSGIHKVSYSLFTKMLEYFQDNSNPYLNYEYVFENISRIYHIDTLFDDSLICININDGIQYNKGINITLPIILKKEKKFDDILLKETFSNIMNIDNNDILEITYAGGLTNTNYKVRTTQSTYILRIPGKCTEEMISRKNEKYNSKLGYLLNMNVDTLYFSDQSGIKITKYIDNAETLNGESAQLEENIKQITAILKNLHNSNAELVSQFKIETELEKYENLVKAANGSFYDGYQEARDLFNYFIQVLNEIGICLKPCHNDLVAENIIKNKQRMYLIDWEYAGYNDPMWDIAAHLVECDFTSIKEELFLAYYFDYQTVSVNNKKKILIFKILQDILWSVWTMAKECNGEDFGTYGIDRMNRAKKLAKEYFENYEC